ncbi:hypothetical protein GA0074692_5346 [Micromonospora pallida]|uniref:Uncharacterized protein n=1 Tax=Micromonospora pallida TaxID=145854 RepID=A0A1C6TC54_9ACTN|nr:hypothetical protein GA0074692_5346 [Micromonospora pallida]
MKRQDNVGILVGTIFLTVAAGAGLLNRTPPRRPLRRGRQA